MCKNWGREKPVCVDTSAITRNYKVEKARSSYRKRVLKLRKLFIARKHAGDYPQPYSHTTVKDPSIVIAFPEPMRGCFYM